jgi:hypothetical protein
MGSRCRTRAGARNAVKRGIHFQPQEPINAPLLVNGQSRAMPDHEPDPWTEDEEIPWDPDHGLEDELGGEED